MAAKDKEIKVTPQALRNFAKMLRDQIPSIEDAQNRINQVDVTAGNFKDANLLRDLIGWGQGGRADQYSAHLASLKLAVERFATELDDMAKKYDTTEALNTDLAAKVGELIGKIEPLLPAGPAG
ncbi:hypothetical protein [Actinomadura decatromicini]|uniref:Uncharacterized protein n=1 Tax=Actinomadura decatromicini TaxID=2604572 RepID=A0A5D3F573_9ACTN|nr:hypothetical protein [Actinomadura decatromicini]TYK43068.1 hypothetical protein FXF68_40010 [Actinomadura decatromicini]